MIQILIFTLLFPIFAYASTSNTNLDKNKETFNFEDLTMDDFLKVLQELENEPFNPKREKELNKIEKQNLIDWNRIHSRDLLDLIFELKDEIVDLKMDIFELKKTTSKK